MGVGPPAPGVGSGGVTTAPPEILGRSVGRGSNHHPSKSSYTGLSRVLCICSHRDFSRQGHQLLINTILTLHGRTLGLCEMKPKVTQLRLSSSCHAQTVSLKPRPKENVLPVTWKRVSVRSFGQRKEPWAGLMTDQRLPHCLNSCFPSGPSNCICRAPSPVTPGPLLWSPGTRVAATQSHLGAGLGIEGCSPRDPSQPDID